MRKKLTSRVVETLPPPTKRRVEYHDELLPGLRFRIYRTGRKTWSVVGRLKGKQVRHTIGTYPIISLADARDAARTILRDMQLRKHVLVDDAPPLRTLGDVVPEFSQSNLSIERASATVAKRRP